MELGFKIVKFAPVSQGRIWCAELNYRESALLSREEIWIKVLTQKRYTVHINAYDIWNDLRPFLKYLVHHLSSKLRSKEAKGLKSGNLVKQKFFSNINFLSYSILFLCTMDNFHLKVA